MIFNKQLFSKPVYLPDKRVIALYGINNGYKKRMLNYLNVYLNKDENVLYINDDTSLISKEMIDTYCILNDLNNISQKGILERIECSYDMSDPFSLQNLEIGSPIHCGYIQLLNYIFSILCDNRKNIVLLIDNFGSRFHPLVKRKMLYDLNHCKNIKQIIFSTYNKFQFNVPISYSEFQYINLDKYYNDENYFKKVVNKI